MLYFKHETQRNAKAARTAPPTCCRVAEKRVKSVGRGQEDWLLCEFGVSMAADLPEERRAGTKAQARSGKTPQALGTPEKSVDPDTFEGGFKLWLSDGALDPAPGGGSDRATIRDLLSSPSCLAGLSRPGLELSEAREAGPGAGRRGHRALEALPLAPYKKRPKGLAPIWSFWMRADFCWFPMCAGPGRLKARPRSCAVQATGARFRRSRPSVFLQNEDTLPCMPGFIPIKTSKTPKWRSFWGISSGTCRVPSLCCGIMAGYIGVLPSANAFRDTPACIQSVFQDMLRNSTLQSLFGTILNVLWPTLSPRILHIFNSSWILRFRGCNNHGTCFGLVFMHQIYRGANVSITFAYINNNVPSFILLHYLIT